MDLFDQIIMPQQKKAVRPDAQATPEHLLLGLNPEQAAAVRHTEGPLLILAGAGSGKTRVITHRIAWLVSMGGVRPSAILAITFTNKAAAEMKSRIEELVGDISRTMWIGTFHAMMIRILRRFADRLGYDRSFTIIDSDDQQKVVKNCIAELNFDDKAFIPKVVHSQIGAAKNALTGADQFTKEAGSDFRLGRIAQIYRLYQEKLKKSNSMDFDDILFEAVRLLTGHPDVLAEYQDRFQHILVDEYQDTNHAQYRLVRLLSDKHRNLCVVGDDDQSIYSFRGANIQNILDFEKDFKNCRVIKLEQNYRSTGTVLNAANAVIGRNQGRKQKTLWTSSGNGELITFLRSENNFEEGRYIAGEINRLVNRLGKQHYRDIAVLYRLNALSRNLESAFRDQGIPYRIFGGMRFYDRKEIKDVLAYLRLILLPGDDLSLARIIHVPRRGIGDTTMEILEKLAAREGKSQLEVCRAAGQYPELQRPAGKLLAFAALIDQFRLRLLQNDLSFAEFIDWVENESGLVQEIIDQQERSKLADSVDRIENLKELLSDAMEFENSLRQLQAGNADELAPEDQDMLVQDLQGVLSAFLERAALYAEMDEDRDNQDYVRLMTIHSAKGLEFGTVFLIGTEEGLFPGYRAMGSETDIEEERRLAYVAITRAKHKLYITTARSRLVFGQTQSLSVSRFIREIPDQYVEEVGGSRHGDRSFGMGRSDGSADRQNGDRAGKIRPVTFPGAPEMTARTTGRDQPAKQQAPINLNKGDRVRHTKFGPGRILSVEPVAGDAILLIEFQSGDKKRLLARMANLEKI